MHEGQALVYVGPKRGLISRSLRPAESGNGGVSLPALLPLGLGLPAARGSLFEGRAEGEAGEERPRSVWQRLGPLNEEAEEEAEEAEQEAVQRAVVRRLRALVEGTEAAEEAEEAEGLAEEAQVEQMDVAGGLAAGASSREGAAAEGLAAGGGSQATEQGVAPTETEEEVRASSPACCDCAVVGGSGFGLGAWAPAAACTLLPVRLARACRLPTARRAVNSCFLCPCCLPQVPAGCGGGGGSGSCSAAAAGVGRPPDPAQRAAACARGCTAHPGGGGGRGGGLWGGGEAWGWLRGWTA